MYYAIVSDIHSNYEAFCEVLNDLLHFNVDEVYVLGDIVGYGPDPNECVKLVKSLKTRAIKGNHERALSNLTSLAMFNPLAAKIITWTKEHLDKDNMEFLDSLPESFIENRTAYVHGSFLSPDKYILESPDVIQEVEDLRKNEINIEFFGHTHTKIIFIEEEGMIIPQDKWISLETDKIYLVNPGSVGQPRDRDQAASYLIYDTDNQSVLYRRIEYAVDKTIKKMQKEGFPPFTYNRLKLGL